jgi:hypothetical protein
MKNSRTLLIVSSIIVLSLCGLLSFNIYRVYSQNRATSLLLEEANQNATEDNLVSSVKKLKMGAAEEIEAFEKLVFTSDKIIEAIEELEFLGRSLNVKVEVTHVEEVEKIPETEGKGLRVALNADGSWSGLFTWLKALESLPYRVMFDQVNFTKTELGWRVTVVMFIPTFD